MKIFYLFLVSIVSFVSQAQVIKGKVLDESKQPIPGANIYFDGTSIATTSNSRGYFELGFSTKINASLVVSFVGYESVYIPDYSDDKLFVIIMKESVNELKEVVIKKDRFTRKQKLNLFKEQFLGNTKAGRNAKILNEDDLDLEYDEAKNILRASADKPLQIINPILGYEVTYEISNFYVSFKKLSIDPDDAINVLFTGVSRFKEIASTEKVIQEREKSYLGSTIHFFRSLVANEMIKNKFHLMSNSETASVSDHFSISDTVGFKKVVLKRGKAIKTFNSTVKFVANYTIKYDSRQKSQLSFFTPYFFVDEFGVHSHVNQINFSGEIGIRRIADLLPTNYGIEEKESK